MTNILLGCGIAGLLAHYYMPDTKIMSPDIGGQAIENVAAPRYLDYAKQTKKLLSDLDVAPQIKKIKLGFYFNNKFYSSPSKKIKLAAAMKKMQETGFKNTARIKDISFGTGGKTIKYFDISFEAIINLLARSLKKEDYIKAKAALVSAKNKFVMDREQHKYFFDTLISTLPAPEFRYILYDGYFTADLRYAPVTFITCNKAPAVFRDMREKYQQIYVVDSHLKYSRVTWTADNKAVCEFTGVVSKEDARAYLDSDMNITNYFVQRVGLITSKPVNDTQNILFLGRLAQWNSNIKVEHVIQKILEMRE